MPYDDKMIMTDMISTQKFIASNYNNYAGECSTKSAKNKLLKILHEEHDIQFKIFEDMQAKGWYPVENATSDKINETVQTHQSAASNMKKEKKPATPKKKKS